MSPEQFRQRIERLVGPQLIFVAGVVEVGVQLLFWGVVLYGAVSIVRCAWN